MEHGLKGANLRIPVTVKLRPKLPAVLLAVLCFLAYVLLDYAGLWISHRWAGPVLGGSFAALFIFLERKQKRHVSHGLGEGIFLLVVGLLAFVSFLRTRNTTDGFVAAASLAFVARELYLRRKDSQSDLHKLAQ